MSLRTVGAGALDGPFPGVAIRPPPAKELRIATVASLPRNDMVFGNSQLSTLNSQLSIVLVVSALPTIQNVGAAGAAMRPTTYGYLVGAAFRRPQGHRIVRQNL